MRIFNNDIPLADWHFHRLQRSIEKLSFQAPGYYSPEYFRARVLELCAKNGIGKSARVRLTLFGGSGGLFDPENHFPNYLIETWPAEPHSGQINENGLVLGCCTGVEKPMDSWANLKSTSFLPYLVAAGQAKTQKWNDALVLNTRGRVADSAIANLFIIKEEKCFTPPLSEGCVAGVMRRYLLERKTNPMPVEEKPLCPEDIEAADEVFLTNAVRGIRWVKSFGKGEFAPARISPWANAVHRELFC